VSSVIAERSSNNGGGGGGGGGSGDDFSIGGDGPKLKRGSIITNVDKHRRRSSLEQKANGAVQPDNLLADTAPSPVRQSASPQLSNRSFGRGASGLQPAADLRAAASNVTGATTATSNHGTINTLPLPPATGGTALAPGVLKETSTNIRRVLTIMDPTNSPRQTVV
jgi:hypothetical protein